MPRARSLDEALASLVHGPRQQGTPAGSLAGKVVLGWGRQNRVTLPSQATTANALFPDATLHGSRPAGTSPTGTSRPRQHG